VQPPLRTADHWAVAPEQKPVSTFED